MELFGNRDSYGNSANQGSAEIQKVMKDDPAREAYARDEKDLVELLLLLKMVCN